MKKAAIFLADGFEEVEALTVVDLLLRAGVKAQMVAVKEDRTVVGSHGISVQADVCFDEAVLADADLLVLPGGLPGTTNLGAHEGVTKLLVDFHAQGKLVAAICAAPGVLGQLGILKGRKAVCHPGFEEKLLGAEVLTEDVAVDGNVTTSRGLGTAIPFSLSLITQLVGREAAKQVAAAIVYPIDSLQAGN